MSKRLYPGEPKQAPRDPLRLAEEYRTFFGQAALNELIRAMITDDAWFPSQTHHALLALPWSDILTTNYDTLLERAARKSERGYQPVTMEGDLAHARSPRIVKLHGSIGATQSFVIAEEDYRIYPDRHAAFVNLARQIFIENELVLLGFSGDDPNFAAWAGWVRDRFSGNARRIYLVGALNLGPAKRKFLEARNIAPIDLHELVRNVDAGERHRIAADLFLAHLASAKPVPAHRWSPAGDPSLHPTLNRDVTHEVERLARIVEVWSAERCTYPGWLICPHETRMSVKSSIDIAPFSEPVLAQMDSLVSARAIVELCWRHRTALLPLHPSMVPIVLRFAQLEREDILPRSDRLAIASTIAWQSRFDDDWTRFKHMAALINVLSPAPSDATAELSYISAARACLNMQFDEAKELAKAVVGDDPFWGVRQAAILAEAGAQDEAEPLVRKAIGDLREREWADRQSIWVLSRLAWAEMLARAFSQTRNESHEWNDRYASLRSDPFDEVRHVRDRILDRQRDEPTSGKVPAFDPGTYTDRSQTFRFRSWSNLDPFYELDLMLLEGGVPPRLEHVNFFTDELIDALCQIEEPSLNWHLHLLRVLKTSKEVFEPQFSRLKIAQLPETLAVDIADKVQSSINYWLDHLTANQTYNFISDNRLHLALRVLSRLVPRLDANKAVDIYRYALGYTKRLLALTWLEPLTDLLKNAWSAVPPEKRPDLIPDTLDLALGAQPYGIEPTSWMFGVLAGNICNDARFQAWLRDWINAAKENSETRSSAVIRLLYVRQEQPLSKVDETAFCDALWAQIDAGTPAMPADTMVRLSFWADVSRPDALDPLEAVRCRLFEATSEISDGRLSNLRWVVSTGRLLPNHEQAVTLFDRLCAEFPPEVDLANPMARFKANMTGYQQRYRQRLLSLTIATLAGTLSSTDRTDARSEAVIEFVSRNDAVAAISALGCFAQTPNTLNNMSTFIRRSLRSTATDAVSDAIEALLIWQKYLGATAKPEEFIKLVEAVISSIEFRRSHAVWHLLRGATALVELRTTSSDQNERLAVSLEELLPEWDYSKIQPASEEAGVVSMVRAGCVKLAHELAKTGVDSIGIEKWLAASALDPLPEVRYALVDDT
jgi:hypothetical protein